jgi:predicted outer membrane lipoprotein
MKISASVLWSLLGVVLAGALSLVVYIWHDHLADDERERARDRAMIEALTREAEVTDEVIDDLASNLARCLEVCE